MDNLKTLSSFLGEEQAKEVIKLTSEYDSYIKKFKNDLNKLLKPVGYEVKAGIMFTKKEKAKKPKK